MLKDKKERLNEEQQKWTQNKVQREMQRFEWKSNKVPGISF